MAADHPCNPDCDCEGQDAAPVPTDVPGLREALAEALHDSDDTCNANEYVLFADCATREWDLASGMYAAAGPALRVGNWRGRMVRVDGIAVRLIDWCSCPDGRLLDLYGSVFRRLAPLSAGVVTVEVSW